eukprot:5736114-Amphidinium_carterae.1
MLSAFCGPQTTSSSVDIRTAFLTADVPAKLLVLLKPPNSLVQLGVVEANQVLFAVLYKCGSSAHLTPS